MFFLASFVYLAYLAIIALVIYVVYKLVDSWVNRLIAVKQDQNAALREIAAALKTNNHANNDQTGRH